MRIEITGITESTITFNDIDVSSGAKLNLHGKETATVEMDTVHKNNEISVLEKAGLIKVKRPKVVEPTPEFTPELTPELTPEPKEEPKEEKNGPKPIKRRRGRPRGSKNKDKESTKEDPTESSRIIVAGEDGQPVESAMTKDAYTDFNESEATRASVEAMEKLEEEEKEERELMSGSSNIDEKELPINEQMGREATIFTGKSATQKEMKNSVIPESAVAKAADPFIDRDIVEEKDTLDEKGNAFLDDISDETNEEISAEDKGGDQDDTFVEL